MTGILDDRAALRLLAVLSVAELTAAYEMSMIFAALKTLLQHFGNPGRVGWLVTSYLLVAAAASAICGRLGDLYGRSRVLLATLACAAAGSLVSAVAPTLEWVIAGRSLQGMAGAVLPLCFGLARENLPEDKVPVAVGVLTAVASVGVAAGLVAGGIIVDQLDWRYIFIASSTLAGVALVAVLAWLPASPRSPGRRKVDALGGILFAPAIAGALLAIGNFRAWAWTDGVLLAASMLVFALWVRHELRHPDPLINVRLLATRSVAVPNLCMALVAVGAMQLVPLMMLLLQQPAWTGVGLGVSATLAGLLKLPGNAVAALGAPWTGYLGQRHGGRYVIIAGAALSTAAWMALLAHHATLWFVVSIAALCSLGTIMTMVGMNSVVVESVPRDRTSEAAGFMQVVKAVFQGVGAQLVLVLLATSSVADPAHPAAALPSPAAYQLTLGFLVVSNLAVLLVALALPRRAVAVAA